MQIFDVAVAPNVGVNRALFLVMVPPDQMHLFGVEPAEELIKWI